MDVPLDPRTPIEAAISQLKTPARLKKDTLLGIHKVMSHPAMQRAKEKLSEASLQCTLIHLWMVAYKALVSSTHSSFALLSIQHIESDLGNLRRMSYYWCENEGVRDGSDKMNNVMKANGITLRLPRLDEVGESRAFTSSPNFDYVSRVYRGRMPAGVLVEHAVSVAGPKFVVEGVPSGALLLVNPAYLYDPTKKADSHQGM
ncbi:hypothetical protein [Archangium primigenium]|uniref:hypothetical protein n=1 Tax=[Archangium] primigenium TaxID=2792470 RepID=UPI00195AF454|nr:hypothetical protein [Archangium primigenium]MBM7116828.1 hypothetical protein [Archangium primigenium]